MGKSQTKKKTNDIDDIFAKKAAPPAAATDDAESIATTICAPSGSTKPKKAKLGQLSADTVGASVSKSAIAKPARKAVATAIMPPADDGLFTDLKGKKKRKTTEEGFKIYDDEELRIDPNAGNTDDCPFDCQCCF